MNLFEKSPVQNPCEAETFEEAARKNRARLAHERDICKDLFDAMKKAGEPGIEAVDPAFWAGAIAANDRTSAIYQEEAREALRRAAERVAAIQGHEGDTKAFLSGWSSIRDSWKKALEKNDPSVIVYW